MTTALVQTSANRTAVEPFEPENLQQARVLAEDIAKSALIPAHLRDKPYDCYVTLMWGRELGLSPMQSVMGIYVEPKSGRPGLYEQTAIALVKKSPLCEYFQMVESSDELATFETKRRGNPRPDRLTFTIEQAKKAGLLSKSNWNAYPASMLRARCALNLARAVYEDVLANVYGPDELDDMRGDVIIKPTAPPPLPSVPAPSAKPTATKASASKATSTPEARAKFEAEAARQAELDKKTAQPDAARSAADLELDKTFGAPQPAEPKPNSPADIGFTAAGGLADPGDAPAPGPKPEDLAGEPGMVPEVDKVKVALSEVADLNGLRALDDRWKALSVEDRKWCTTEYFAALLRIIKSAPFADLDGAGARLNGMKKSGALTPQQYEEGSSEFLARQKAGK